MFGVEGHVATRLQNAHLDGMKGPTAGGLQNIGMRRMRIFLSQQASIRIDRQRIAVQRSGRCGFPVPVQPLGGGIAALRGLPTIAHFQGTLKELFPDTSPLPRRLEVPFGRLHGRRRCTTRVVVLVQTSNNKFGLKLQVVR